MTDIPLYIKFETRSTKFETEENAVECFISFILFFGFRDSNFVLSYLRRPVHHCKMFIINNMTKDAASITVAMAAAPA